ncbi:MAG: HhH-GPD family protein, partial [Terriglobales bacterium]
LKRFPNVKRLAAAEEVEVLALWSGLGYYRRARQLRAAAVEIGRRHAGRFPRAFEALLELPGIGRYTAGAVLSMAHGVAVPAVDGNVVRVYRRMIGGSEVRLRPIEAAVALWVDPLRPGDFNQALMELGATVCTPRTPNCHSCPLQPMCRTRGEGGPATRKQAKLRYLTPRYALQQRTTRRGLVVGLVQRSPTAALMPGMWELPPHSGVGSVLGTVTHAITTSRIRAEIVAPATGRRPPAGKWMRKEEALTAPLTGLTRKVLRRFLGWG